LKQNRKEIEEALLVLAPQSDEQHRKLDYSINPPVISFELMGQIWFRFSIATVIKAMLAMMDAPRSLLCLPKLW
jgi:hypothetical protein